jgi:hypothetical protein
MRNNTFRFETGLEDYIIFDLDRQKAAKTV